MASVALVPLRGLRFRDEVLDFDPFQREWTLLSIRQMELLSERYPAEHSIHGNLVMIQERLAPDAYLLVACDDPSSPGYRRAYERAETILGAICIITLLAPEDPEGDRQYSPHPLLWTRVREYCELPLVIDSERVRLVGHSSILRWLSPDTSPPSNLCMTNNVSELAAVGPRVTREILAFRQMTAGWQIRLVAGARAIHAGFQATSPGQLIANMVSAAEVLVTLGDRKSWGRRIARLKVLIGPTYWTRVEAIMTARHDYVHESKQPQFEYLAFGALALSVQAWAVLHEMCEQVQDLENVLRKLDQLADVYSSRDRTTQDLLADDMASLNAHHTGVPRGPLRRLHWINQALSDIHPNDYYVRYSIFGATNCPQCGTFLRQEHVTQRTSAVETFSCPKCGVSVEALLPFAGSR